jgi:hypothetical protein
MTDDALTANVLRVAVGDADARASATTDVYDLWSEKLRGLDARGSA